MGTVPTEQPAGLAMWIAQNGQMVFFFAQLAYWLIIAGAVVFAVAQAKRYVDMACGIAPSAKDDAPSYGTAEKADEIEVEKFVE